MKTPKNFEEGLARLQDILAQMQRDDTSLEKSVKLYAEAAQLIAYCNTALHDAQIQIEEIDTSLSKQLSSEEA